MVETTFNLIDKIGDVVASTRTVDDPPLVLETAVVSIAIAVKDIADSAGDKIDSGGSSITLENNEGLTGILPLQVGTKSLPLNREANTTLHCCKNGFHCEVVNF